MGGPILYSDASLFSHASDSLPNTPVRITEVEHIGTPHFRVETPDATFFIERRSGGCSSLIDREGRDWIGFRKTGNDNPTNSADSDYRGLPNLVFREPGDGIGHPGFDVCTTDRVSANELQVRSKNGQWSFRWVFHPDHAELIVDQTDPDRAYWFLYEGPVGGAFDPAQHLWGNDVDGLRTDRPSIYEDPVGGQWQWAFFGDRRRPRVLFLVQAEADQAPDYFAYMGNDPASGNRSADGMTVFGFGRGLQTDPQLRGPNRFLVGFFPRKVDGPATLAALRRHLTEMLVR